MVTGSCWKSRGSDEAKSKLGPAQYAVGDNLQKMTEQGPVEEVPSARGEDSRRKYYRLTSFGRKVLAAEIARLETLVREAKAHLRRPAAGRASS